MVHSLNVSLPRDAMDRVAQLSARYARSDRQSPPSSPPREHIATIFSCTRTHDKAMQDVLCSLSLQRYRAHVPRLLALGADEDDAFATLYDELKWTQRDALTYIEHVLPARGKGGH